MPEAIKNKDAIKLGMLSVHEHHLPRHLLLAHLFVPALPAGTIPTGKSGKCLNILMESLV